MTEHTGIASPPAVSGGGGSVDIDDLYARNPGAVQVGSGPSVGAPEAEAGQTGVASQASSSAVNAANATLSGYGASTQDPSEGASSAKQLNDITSRQSPLMMRAAKTGLLQAGKRGLMNSSIAAGAAQGQMVDKAAPFALQDAQVVAQQDIANQSAENRAREFTSGQENLGALENARLAQQADELSAKLETAVSQGNTEEANRLRALQAQMETEVNTRNADRQFQSNATEAEMQNQRDLTNMAAENRMRESVLNANSEMNRQYLAGTQAMDLASIQGRYQQLISSNQAAASLYQSYFDGISQAMANDRLQPERVAQYVNVQQSMLEAGLRMMDSMNSLDLGDFQLPGATGDRNTITPTPGSGVTAPVGAPPAPPSSGGYTSGGDR